MGLVRNVFCIRLIISINPKTMQIDSNILFIFNNSIKDVFFIFFLKIFKNVHSTIRVKSLKTGVEPSILVALHLYLPSSSKSTLRMIISPKLWSRFVRSEASLPPRRVHLTTGVGLKVQTMFYLRLVHVILSEWSLYETLLNNEVFCTLCILVYYSGGWDPKHLNPSMTRMK